MKIRSGFVSNSSSSSFCIYGASLDFSEIHKFASTIDKDEVEKFCKENKKNGPIDSWVTRIVFDDPNSDDIDFDSLIEFINWKYAPEINLDYVSDYEGSTIYIGRDEGTIGDDETGRQFKESPKFLSKLFPGTSVEWHQGEICC